MVVFFVLLLSIPVVVRFFLYKKSMQALDTLSNFLSGKTLRLSFLYDIPAFKGEYQGVKFEIRISIGKRQHNDSPSLIVLLDKKSFLKLDIFSKKKAMNLLGRNLSAGLKVNIEDEEYKGLPIFTNDNIRVIDYLKDEQIKRLIQELLNMGVPDISITGSKIIISKPFYNLREDLNEENITNILNALIVLTKRL